jgi:hypothetical protein
LTAWREGDRLSVSAQRDAARGIDGFPAEYGNIFVSNGLSSCDCLSRDGVFLAYVRRGNVDM